MLAVWEVAQPPVPDDGVLVRVRAASIHIGDCHLIRGVPKSMRPIYGLRRPRDPVPGMDLAGIVEAAGSAVTGVHVGDEVHGDGAGAFAEYAVAKADNVAPRPESLSLEAAAALGSRPRRHCRRCATSSGSSRGSRCSSSVLLAAWAASRSSSRGSEGLDNVVKALVASFVNKQQLRPFISTSTGADALALKALVDEGHLKKTAIDRVFTLEEGPQAIAHVAAGHGQGKTVIAINAEA